ncbi:RHS repeat-associated core domain-containing protein [Microbulbifer rhizosphaerae]|uniref:RHS repeat-associated protein n=1 Tax=Microbulbifer rhizosphaerae TaxID=1562603 RepID=A0A7W4WDX8_9GAMM|nr:RHS repeat-associated core domain-containing protein [Microbulbifer rhizosphaerae]MBB3062446.1 RHS repeat-associated protein [Microbulbifer rhizosphaerae]
MPSGSYRYRVRAYARAGSYYQYSGWKYSTTVTVKHYPDQVQNWLEPGGSTLPGSSFQLSWRSIADPDPSDPVTHYQLKWSIGGSGYSFVPFVDPGLNGSNLGKKTLVTISEATTGREITATAYKFKARACNKSGCGHWTDPVKQLTPPMPPEAAFTEDLPEHFYKLDQTITWKDATTQEGVKASSYRLKRTRKEQDEPGCETEEDGYCWSTPVPHTTANSYFDGASDPGEYLYKLEACNDFECDSTLSHWIKVHSLENIDEKPAVKTEAPDTPGTLAYSADVGARGDAVITVPLQPAPGVNGLQPNLFLHYTSARFHQRINQTLPEDILGYGWRVGGFSSIRRCVVNRPQADKIQLNDSDSLCLDGEPLVLISGTHWQAGAQYRTLRDSFRLIELKEDAGGWRWFQIKGPDGRVSDYGTSVDSRLRAGNSPYFAWSLKTVTDAFGNALEYKYHNDVVEGINYPLEITYGNEGDAKIEFQYGTRTDAPPVPLEEIQQKQLVLLHHVRVHLDGALHREYKLISEEEPADPDEEHTRRLKQIQLCAYDPDDMDDDGYTGRQCLNPLVFSWKYTDSANPEDFETGIETVTDGLGAQAKFVLDKITDEPGSEEVGRFDEGEILFGPVGTIPDASPLQPVNNDYRTVVTEVHRSNGYSNSWHVTEYAYQGVGLKSDKHWGFLGYTAQRIYDTQADIVTYRQYRQDFPYFGKLARQLQYKSNYNFGELLTRQRFSHATLTLDAGDGDTYFPYVAQSLETLLEGGKPLGYAVTDNLPEALSQGTAGDLITGSLQTSRTLGNADVDESQAVWGQVVPATEYAEVERSVETTTLFDNRVSGNWLIGFTTAREQRYFSGEVSDSPDQVESLTATPLAGSNKVHTVTQYPNDPEYHLAVTYSYDDYGNLSSESATGKVDTEINGVGTQTRSTSVEGDFLDRRYATTIKNALDQSISLEYDPRFGAVSKVTDANTRTTEIGYDPFGREVRRTNPDDIVFNTQYNFCHGICPTVGGIEVPYWAETDSSISPKTERYYDQLGRLVQQDMEAFTGSAVSRREFKYDLQGRLATETAPFFADGAVAVDGYKPITQYDYDHRNRLDLVQKANGGTVDIEYADHTADGSRQVKVSVTETVIGESGTSTQVKESYYGLTGDLARTVDDAGTNGTSVATDYTYYGSGLPETVTVTGDSRNFESSFTFDHAGFRTGLTDPNLGSVTSNYSAFGQLERQTDNKSQSITYLYDQLGRLLEQADADGLAEWNYDAPYAKGSIESRSYTEGGTRVFHETFSYRPDDGKLDKITTALTAGGISKTYDHGYDYDGSGRLNKIVYPNGVEAHYQYNGRGYLSVLNAQDDPVEGLVAVKTFNDINAWGQVKQETYGNNLVTNRTYNPDTGRLETIDTDSGNIQNNEYRWRTNGTLESRFVYSGSQITKQEDFTYDGLNRLKDATMTIGGSRKLSTLYDKLGNITSKTSNQAGDTDVTGYQYGEFGNAGPNAVSNVNINGMAHSLQYDLNGAIERYDAASGDDKWITWNARQLATEIVVGNSRTTSTPTARDRFQYGPDGNRFYRESSWMEDGQLKTEKVFIVGSYEELLPLHDGNIQKIQKTALDGNVQHIAIDDLTGTTAEYQYLHRDHLGSVEKVTDESGAVILDTAFDPYGGRRQANWRGDISQQQLEELLLSQGFTTKRGYTGHEHLDRTGLIHMNGRIYDPTLGRFLSPDPIVQAPTNSQSWNRYSYAFNNPLSFTDPSGFESEEDEVPEFPPLPYELDENDDTGGGGGYEPNGNCTGSYTCRSGSSPWVKSGSAWLSLLLHGSSGRGARSSESTEKAKGQADKNCGVEYECVEVTATQGATSSLIGDSSGFITRDSYGHPVDSELGALFYLAEWLSGAKATSFLKGEKIAIGISKKGLKHLKKHLKDFQKLDSNFTLKDQIKLGKKIAGNPANLVNVRNGSRGFEAVVNVGGNSVQVRAVLNAAGNLRSVYPVL